MKTTTNFVINSSVKLESFQLNRPRSTPPNILFFVKRNTARTQRKIENRWHVHRPKPYSNNNTSICALKENKLSQLISDEIIKLFPGLIKRVNSARLGLKINFLSLIRCAARPPIFLWKN
jgi:hypothetical protein